MGHNLLMGEETENQRKEANTFANEFYCPQVLIIHYNLLTTGELMSTFGITEKYAQLLLDMVSRRRAYKYSPSEERLLRIFLNNKKK